MQIKKERTPLFKYGKKIPVAINDTPVGKTEEKPLTSKQDSIILEEINDEPADSRVQKRTTRRKKSSRRRKKEDSSGHSVETGETSSGTDVQYNTVHRGLPTTDFTGANVPRPSGRL